MARVSDAAQTYAIGERSERFPPRESITVRLEQLREKAQMLGETTDVVVHDRHAGFSRFVQPGCEASDRHRQGLVKFGVDRPTNAETSSS
jgi:hypothetical protein